MDLIEYTGMVVALDIGNIWTLHPEYKKEFGGRLLYRALNKTYGHKSNEFESPIYCYRLGVLSCTYWGTKIKNLMEKGDQVSKTIAIRYTWRYWVIGFFV